ncbi:MAG: DNA recombination protein RmuC [Prevotellaceae bacterium]|jgi:DNA recombination protein RmuC|nr:DNA recombination protein RmuC [Prevotellaceae bacterium]
MDIIFILAGAAAGFAIARLVFGARSKAGSISKADYAALSNQLGATNVQLKIAEDRLSMQQQEHARLTQKLEAQEAGNVQQQAKLSSLETTIGNNEQKISELAGLLAEQTKKNEEKQAQLNLLLQQLAEKNAAGTSLSENLKAQKEAAIKQAEALAEQARKNEEKQAQINLLQQQLAEKSAVGTSLSENLKAQKEVGLKQAEELARLNEKLTKTIADNSALTANSKALAEKLATQKEEIAAIQKTAHLQFEKIAAQILEEKSGKFTEVNKANIEALLKPLGENISSFKKKVEETYDKESKQRFSLEEKVKELVEQTNKVSSEANNLATALKGQAKKQGNWGEMILESILQQSGLVKNREYFLQQTIRDEEGKNLRPDVLVALPDSRVIIIDSKVSLVAYDRFSSADSVEEQAAHLSEHLKSIYAHIDELSGKKYDNLEKSLDFTMMFVPIEPAYLLAIQNDPSLWAYAYSRRILLISPTNLIACLKLMADLWKREMQSKNAQEIVRRGELLYDKFVSFVGTLEDVGRHIGKTQQAYEAAIGLLRNGSGNLIGQAVKLKSLGLKSSKEIPSAMLPTDLELELLPEEADEKRADEKRAAPQE